MKADSQASSGAVGKSTLYLVGVDGLAPAVIAPMVEQGELPHLARLAREGCYGPLETTFPTDSPIIWTSIATGQSPRAHGIEGFHRAQIMGIDVGHALVRRLRKMGFKYVLKALMRMGIMKRFLYDSRNVRVKRLWDIVSDCGGKAGVVNWWNTWPADPISGFIVSDRLHFWRSAATGELPPEQGLLYPDTLLSTVQPLVQTPDEVTIDDIRRFVCLSEEELREFAQAQYRHHDWRSEIRFLISADRTYSSIFDHGLSSHPDLDLAAVYFRAPDIAQHCAFDFMPSATLSKATPEERRKFGRIVPETYRFADELVGRIIGRMRPEDSIMVLSDHGYGYETERKRYGHSRGNPPGVLYCMGPVFRKGVAIEGANVYDIAPTALRVLGLPASRAMCGKCLESLFTEAFRAKHPPQPPVDQYGPHHTVARAPSGSKDVDEDVSKHLRALGYMD